MDQIVPDFSSTVEERNDSIDDTPQPIESDDKYLPQLFATYNSQLNQTMKFRLGTLYSQDVYKSHKGPVDFSVDNVHQENFEEPLDPPSLEISSECASPMESSSNNGLELNYADRLCFNVLQFTDYDSNYDEPLPPLTKLASDELQAINKALLCFVQFCQDTVCKKGKDILDRLKKSIQKYDAINCKKRLLLEFLLNHKADCMEILCIAPGCDQSICSLDDLIVYIREENSNKLDYSNNDKFYKFSSNCWVNSPKEVNEKTMCWVTSSNSISIYRKDNCWSKITLLREDLQDILPTLEKIGRLSNHPNILPIEWIIDSGSISYCTEHYAEPLKNKLSFMELNIKDLILQLIEAALYLNYNEIAFLAWTTENVYYKHGRVMLGNFHMGSALFNDFDSGLIKCILFPTIIPPELNSNCVTLTKADVWGACCLLFELLTHKVVHSHLLHMERTHVWKMLDEHGWKPNCQFTDESLQSIFNQGWEEKPEHRISLNQLKREILNLTFSNNV